MPSRPSAVRLDPQQQRRLDRWHQQWGRTLRQTGELRDAGEQLVRAGQQPAAAGYPIQTNSGPGPKGGHGDPTLAHIEHAAGGRSDPNRPQDDTPDTWPEQPDAVHEWLAELVALGSRIRRDVDRAARLKDMIVNRKDPRVHDVGGHCKACGRKVTGGPDDRLRTELCDSNARGEEGGGSCYREWLAWRRPFLEQNEPAALSQFCEWRKRQLDERFGRGAA